MAKLKLIECDIVSHVERQAKHELGEDFTVDLNVILFLLFYFFFPAPWRAQPLVPLQRYCK